MGEINDDDLDDILDSALDDFSEPAKPAAVPPSSSSTSSKNASSSSPSATASSAPPNMNDIFADLNNPAFRSEFEQFMKELDPSFNQNLDSLVSNPDFLSELSNVQSLLSGLGFPNPEPAPSSSSSSSSSTSAPPPSAQKVENPSAPKKTENLQSKITETLNQLKSSDEEAQSEVGTGEDPLASLLNMMNGGGAGGSPEMMEGLLEGMIGQLMSKEVLYEPMKELATLYPVWLEESKATLSEAEYKRCQAQYEVTVKIVEVYENQEGDSKPSLTKVLELMQQMQEYGQPPASLLQRMAPGLEIGQDGLPKIPGLGADQCPVM